MSDPAEEKWVCVYQAALLELSHSLMAGRIMDTRSEILKRLEILRDMPGLHRVERQAIQDALSALRSLEREEVRYVEGKQREAANIALEKLRSIESAISRQASSISEQE